MKPVLHEAIESHQTYDASRKFFEKHGIPCHEVITNAAKQSQSLADALDIIMDGGPEAGTPYEDWARVTAQAALANYRKGE